MILPILASLLAGVGRLDSQPAPITRPALEDTASLGHFLDGVLTEQLEQLRMPGGIVVVVKGDRVLYARGYGFADLAKRTPIDPATSMLQIGSTGKLFTWTAIMQLVEAGKLDLDRDVNSYLKTFQIPQTFPQPITLRHLLTHTAGFQEGVIGYFIGTDSTNLKSIEATMREHVPVRVRPPGQVPSYSNYGASLAGLIIEQVSGEPFAEYLERHLFQPLGMRYATFREPVPAPLRPYVITGYQLEDGVFKAQPPENDGGFVPSGGVYASGLDMARFMLAHLHDGQLGSERILGAETARLMHRTAFAPDPRLPGMALGFIERRLNGRHLIGHDGDSYHSHTELILDPEAQVGVYVGYSGDAGVTAREAFARVFFDRYFPAAPSVPPTPPSDFTTMAAKYQGAYRLVRMNYTDIDKVIYLFALPPIRVSVMAPNRLLVTGGEAPDTPPSQYQWIGKDLFQQVDGDGQIGFVEERGKITRLLLTPTIGTERAPWYEQAAFWEPVLGVAAIILLSVMIGFWYRRQEIRSLPQEQRWPLVGSLLAASWLFASVAAVALVVGIYQMAILQAVPLALEIVLAMPVIFALMTIALVGLTLRAWLRGYWSIGRRIHYTLATAAAVAFTAFFAVSNILGWQFG